MFYFYQRYTIRVAVLTGTSLRATVGDSLDFSCTYTLEGDEVVYPGRVSWEIKKDSAATGFESIATFAPPNSGGSNAFTSTESGLKFKDRSELPDVTSDDNTTFNVVMRVRNVDCADEDSYRCNVNYVSSTQGPSVVTAETSLTVQAPAEKPYAVPVPVPDNIEEGMNVKFTCTANVGKPPGKIRWWRYRSGIIAPQPMGDSSENPQVQPKVCVYNVTSSIEHNMSSDDDQSVWRCSVDNELLTTQPDQNKPNQESQRVNVYYKVRVPTIWLRNAGNKQYPVGSDVTLICEADGNPRPRTYRGDRNINKYVWTFRADPSDNATKLASNNGDLQLTNLQESQTGIYTCTAFNGFNGKSFNASRDTSLQIERPPETPHESHQLVAFYARTSTSEKAPNGNHILVFDNVVTNVGNGYNGFDDVFIVPRDGVYVFIWVVRLHESQRSTQLMINNVEYGSTHFRAINGDDGSVSGNVLTHVNKGDVVFIRVYTTTNAYRNTPSNGHGKSTFSGWLLR
ncbi:uncharacterized protein LOC125681554 [Ostrea edulis]|uniref:uncharacterized protein LOC125681554 n=1 Tax=Ostrea edulis TaxID=37623 RepID=UPI0024AEC20B|nr:uncharacterized protein LOC125681554 [Ostrea edulis]